MLVLHPEHAEAVAVAVPGCRRAATLCFTSTLPGRQRQREANSISGVRWLDNTVVPETRRCVQCSRLLLDLVLKGAVFCGIPAKGCLSIRKPCGSDKYSL